MKKLFLAVIIGCLLWVPLISYAAPAPIVFKVAIADPPTIKIGDMQVHYPGYAALLAFQSAMDKYSNGRVKVELYPNGRLGDVKSALEQVLSGNIGATQAADGFIGPFYKNIQILAAPYVLKDPIQTYDILDGPFGQKLFDDMAAKSNLRVLASYENGGFRSFTNNKKVIKVPDDMKGMKIRTMDSPIFQEIVKATGASPTPVAWLELYSALQTGVVDGEENPPILVLSASLQEVQKYYTLNNHVLSTLFLVANDKYLKSLPPDLQEAFVKAGREASIAGRGAFRANEALALESLKKAGMNIYVPTPEETQLWEKTREPALKWLRENTDKALLDEFLAAAKASEHAKTLSAGADNAGKKEASGSSTLTYAIIGGLVVLIALFAIFGRKKRAA